MAETLGTFEQAVLARDCAILALEDFQTVSGDLLEEYREGILPGRRKHRADLWYLGQVAGFAWRANRTRAGLLSGAVVARTALDWLVPTANFNADDCSAGGTISITKAHDSGGSCS